MKHRHHLYFRALQRAETTFDDQQALVAEGRVFQADGIVIGFKHPLAVVTGRFLDRLAVKPELSRLGDGRIGANRNCLHPPRPGNRWQTKP